MKFYDLHVHAEVESAARLAAQLKYAGIGLIFPASELRHLDSLKERLKIGKECGLCLYLGFEAKNLQELILLRKYRKSYDLLVVAGGSLALNRKACQTAEVDVLAHPGKGRLDPGVDCVAMRFAAEHKVAIEINFKEISGPNRLRALRNAREVVKLAQKYGTLLLLSSGAENEWELKDPYCMLGMAIQIGMEVREAKQALSSVPERIVELSKEKQSPSWIMPGVRVR